MRISSFNHTFNQASVPISSLAQRGCCSLWTKDTIAPHLLSPAQKCSRLVVLGAAMAALFIFVVRIFTKKKVKPREEEGKQTPAKTIGFNTKLPDGAQKGSDIEKVRESYNFVMKYMFAPSRREKSSVKLTKVMIDPHLVKFGTNLKTMMNSPLKEFPSRDTDIDVSKQYFYTHPDKFEEAVLYMEHTLNNRSEAEAKERAKTGKEWIQELQANSSALV